MRALRALYIGGMGSREKNFYNQLAVRMGYEAEAAEVQDLYLARDYDGAAAAVPFEFIDRTSLIGPPERVQERLQRVRRRRRHHADGRDVRRRARRADRDAAHDGRGARRIRARRVSRAWFEAIVLGIVQGLTEFLPISSTRAPAASCPQLFGWDDPGAAFTAVTQIGTEAAVIIYFRRDIVAHRLRPGRGRSSGRSCAAHRRADGLVRHHRHDPDRACSGFAFRDQIETARRATCG